MGRTLKVAAAMALITALAPFAPVAEAAGTVTVSGTAPQGYSVLMIAKSGNSIASKGGNFKIKTTAAIAKGATLHLVSNSGKYAGPVTLKFDKNKKTGNTQLSGKTGSIGKIAMKTGYSVAAAKATTAISTTAKIKVTTAGQPGGAGRMGMPSSTGGASVRIFGAWKLGDGDAPKGEDTDKDGLPNTLDLDDDNDSKIDLVDDSNPSKAVTTGSLLFLDISKTINLHAGMDEAKMQQAIDLVFASNNNVWIGINLNTAADGSTPDGIHISCAAEVKWCAPGSPATLFGTGGMNNSSPEKWADKRADGFALSVPKGDGPNCDTTSTPMMGGACGNSSSSNFNRQFIPKLPSADVAPGSMFTLNLTKGGVIDKSVAGTLSPYFAAVPALKEVTVAGQVKAIDYSKKGDNGPGAANGTQGNPIIVPQGGQTVILTFWRPQRSGVSEAGEGRYVDMGGLRYGFYVSVNRACDAGAMTPVSSTLSAGVASKDLEHTPLVDSAKDAAPNSANTLSFTVDLTKCTGNGAPSMSGGNGQMVTLIASSPGNGGIKAYQDFYIKVQ
ncbi:MAG: hypothetical protein ACKODP_05470 [Actinomycetota bacterium]